MRRFAKTRADFKEHLEKDDNMQGSTVAPPADGTPQSLESLPGCWPWVQGSGSGWSLEGFQKFCVSF